MIPKKHFSRYRNGFGITFDNGYFVDATFGAGNYAENRHEYQYGEEPEDLESENCETIIIDGDGVDRTLEIGKCLGLNVNGDKDSAVLPYLHFNDWMRIINYVNAILPRNKP